MADPQPPDPPPDAHTLNRLQRLYGDHDVDFPRPSETEAGNGRNGENAAARSAPQEAPPERATLAPSAKAPGNATPPPPINEIAPQTASKKREPVRLVAAEHTRDAARKPNVDALKAASAVVVERLKSFQPVDLATLPAEVQRSLACMRSCSDDAISRDTSLAPSKEMGHDLRLLRFLIGAKWDPGKAAEDYVSVLKQRRDLKVDVLRNRVVAANPNFFELGSDDLAEIHFHPSSAAAEARMPRLWVRPNGAGLHTLLRHKQGHLLVCDYAPDFARISAVGEAAWHETELAFNELQILVLDELSHRSGCLTMSCKVTDVLNRESALASSLNPVNPWASKGEKQFKASGALMKNLYPTVVFKWFMVNLAKAWKGKVKWAVDNFGGRSAYKMFVCDADFHKEVLAEANASQLPSQLGGQLPAAAFAETSS